MPDDKSHTLKDRIEAANHIVLRLREHGYEAYWVGGCVRNKLLGLPPEDIDIATNARPQDVITLFPKTISVGATFGVVLVHMQSVETEVATFRSDGIYLDARHPEEVHFSSAKDDAKRRDFTINALFYDPVEDRIIDFVGGRKDLEQHLIRAVGSPEKRFNEDALRMLRAIRFSASLEFQIEPSTWNALLTCKPLIRKISADRIRAELIKMFTGNNAGRALELLDRSSLLVEILPEVADMKNVQQPHAFHPEGDVFTHTLKGLDLLKHPSPTLAFGWLLHDIGKPPTYEERDRIRFNFHHKVGVDIADSICRRLNFSNADRKRIKQLVERHMQFINIKEMRESTLRRFLAADTIQEDLELHRVDCLASHGDLENYDFAVHKLEELSREQKQPLPPPLINGDDLIALGYKPGPAFKTILHEVQEAQLEGLLHTKDETVEYVRKKFST
jgi:tRNA nucleotidyltransferase/poly(A) polymerase